MVAERHLVTIRDYTRRIARALKVIGLMNMQYAIKDDAVYVLEVNPRASRTVPYLSKATGVPLAKVAARVMAGRTLAELGLTEDLDVSGVFVKTPVFPFVRFPGVDTILGPEMKSTGEVMGGAAQLRRRVREGAARACGQLPARAGTAFISVNNDDKPTVLPIARDLADLGFTIVATRGTAAYLRAHGLQVDVVFKVNEGRPNVADQIVNGKIDLIVNTPLGRDSFFDDRAVRRVAMMQGVACITTLTGASAAGRRDPRAAHAGARCAVPCRTTTPGSPPKPRPTFLYVRQLPTPNSHFERTPGSSSAPDSLGVVSWGLGVDDCGAGVVHLSPMWGRGVHRVLHVTPPAVPSSESHRRICPVQTLRSWHELQRRAPTTSPGVALVLSELPVFE